MVSYCQVDCDPKGEDHYYSSGAIVEGECRNVGKDIHVVSLSCTRDLLKVSFLMHTSEQ